MPIVCDPDLSLSAIASSKAAYRLRKLSLTFALGCVNWPLGKIGKPMGFAFDALAETVPGTAQSGSPARAWQIHRAPFSGNHDLRGF